MTENTSAHTKLAWHHTLRQSNLLCRRCKEKAEKTQAHIFKECESLMEAQNCNYENILKNEASTLGNTAQSVENITKLMEENERNSLE